MSRDDEPKSTKWHVVTMVVGYSAFAFCMWQGATGPREWMSFWTATGGAGGFAPATRSAWSLIQQRRERRRAQEASRTLS